MNMRNKERGSNQNLEEDDVDPMKKDITFAEISRDQVRKLDKLRSDNELDEAAANKFYEDKMKTIDDFLGPQFCALCDDPIQNSVKIRSVQHDTIG